MVSILKDIPIDGVQVVLCRVNGPRDIVKSFLVAGTSGSSMKIYPKGVTPECFYRGSNPSFAWVFPINACGNHNLVGNSF